MYTLYGQNRFYCIYGHVLFATFYVILVRQNTAPGKLIQNSYCKLALATSAGAYILENPVFALEDDAGGFVKVAGTYMPAKLLMTL